MNNTGKPWWILALAVSTVAVAFATATLLWPALSRAPTVPFSQPIGPVLLQAQQAGVLKIAMRSYTRPALPGASQPPEPEVYDWALAEWLGQQLGVPVKQAAATQSDLILEGIAPRHPGDYTRNSYMSTKLQLLALKQQAPQWEHLAPGNWSSWLLPRQASLTPTVCIAAGQATTSSLQMRGLQPLMTPSSVHAISDFLAGKCHLLAESPELVSRLLQQRSWRFYTRLGNSFQPQEQAPIRLRLSDTQSIHWLQHAVQQWQRSELQHRAQQHRVSTIALEATLLENGAICH